MIHPHGQSTVWGWGWRGVTWHMVLSRMVATMSLTLHALLQPCHSPITRWSLISSLVTNIKSWKWQWVLSVARSQRVNNAPALLAGTSAFGVLSSMEEVQWPWAYHIVRKSGSHGQAMCRYSGWQSQMRPQPTDLWHHHRHQPLDIRVGMLPDDPNLQLLTPFSLSVYPAESPAIVLQKQLSL